MNNSRDFLRGKSFTDTDPFTKFAKISPCKTYPLYGVSHIVGVSYTGWVCLCLIVGVSNAMEGVFNSTRNNHASDVIH